MIKNQLYPYIEEYINNYLHGFTKEQLEVGVMNGEIKLENLNLRPDGINNQFDELNIPFWLKAGFISKIHIGCSLMNFIGEKPLEAYIEGINIILIPSYKWIIKNLDSYLFEDSHEMKNKYDPLENNSNNIFTKKINVFDNSFFKKETFEKIFSDQTQLSEILNKILDKCLSFYYSKNFSVIFKLKNIHIRFEDDQLINYFGDIAFGCKIENLEITLSTEGIMKKDYLKLSKMDIYWENNAKILIPSSTLNNSLKNGVISDNYYSNIKKIKFQEFCYKKNTKFFLENFNFMCNFGIKSIDQGKIDLFSQSNINNNSYRVYIQLASSEININLFPELLLIRDSLRKFMKYFLVLEQVQEFKPMRKPYDSKNRNFIEMLNFTKKDKNNIISKNFLFKRKMQVRDWLYYFFWCNKCKSSIYTKMMNPLRVEFSRFYGLCFKNYMNYNSLDSYENIKQNAKNENITENNKNPDKIKISLISEIKLKSLNVNFNSLLNNNNENYINLKINTIDFKINLSKDKFDFDSSIKNILIGPNKLTKGDRVIISSKVLRKKDPKFSKIPTSASTSMYNNHLYRNYRSSNDIDSNTGLSGLVKKYNPLFDQKLKLIDDALGKINTVSFNNNSKVHLRNNNSSLRNMSHTEDNLSVSDINSSFYNENNKKDIPNRYEQNTFLSVRKNNFGKCSNSFTNNKNEKIKNNFAKNLIRNYEPTPLVQRMELKKQKQEFCISQAISEYNNQRNRERLSSYNNNYSIPTNQKLNGNKVNDLKLNDKNDNINNQIISTGQNVSLNLIEIDSSTENNSCFSLKYTKINDIKNMDILDLNLGTIRINLISEYLAKFAEIIRDYKKLGDILKIKSDIQKNENSEHDFTIEKKLFKLREYIYNYITKMPDKKKNSYIKDYLAFIKSELDKTKKFLPESDNFEINYLFSYFTKGIKIYFDYETCECVYYNNKGDKICGKAILPPPRFNLKLNTTKINFNIYDFEFEISDLENTKELINTIKNIIKEKLKFAGILLQPCIKQISLQLNNNPKQEMSSTDELLHQPKMPNIPNKLKNNLNKKITPVNFDDSNVPTIKLNDEIDFDNKNINQNDKKSKSSLKNHNLKIDNKNNKEIIHTLQNTEEDDVETDSRIMKEIYNFTRNNNNNHINNKGNTLTKIDSQKENVIHNSENKNTANTCNHNKNDRVKLSNSNHKNIAVRKKEFDTVSYSNNKIIKIKSLGTKKNIVKKIVNQGKIINKNAFSAKVNQLNKH